MSYNKMTPREKRVAGRLGKGAEDLEARGREFWCLDCLPGEGKRLGSGEVVGTLVQGFFHKGRLGHRVNVTQGRVETGAGGVTDA